MKIRIFAVVCLLAANLFTISAQKWFTPEAEKQVDALLSQVVEGNYKNNRYPLLRKPLMELPLGSIKPKGLVARNAGSSEKWRQWSDGCSLPFGYGQNAMVG